jgi:cytidylate kinase
MAVITISRGTFSGGKSLAECLSLKLGYRAIDRDVIVERAAARGGVSERELRTALERPPAQVGTLDHRKYIYLALMQHALVEEVREGRVIYHGLLGHLLLKGGVGVLRLRVIAPMSYRIRSAMERLNFGRAEACAHIDRMDDDRRKWTRFLHGVDWEDPSLYDLVINLEHIRIDHACRLVTAITRESDFEFSPECRAAMADLALASRVRAELALNPFTKHLEVTVDSSEGNLTIGGLLAEQVEDMEKVVREMPGVRGITVKEAAPAA